MIYLTAFFAMAAMDFCFSYYARRVSQGKAHSASMWAMSLIMFNAIVMVAVVETRGTIIAAMLGAYVGTYAAVRRDSEQD